MNFFTGKTIVLELSRNIRFKEKQNLINYLRGENSQISFILTASTDYVFVSDDVDTYKTRRAKQLGIPLVDVQFIYEYQKCKGSVDLKRFIVTTADDRENFSRTGTIAVTGTGSTIKTTKFDPSKIKLWNSDDAQLPNFDELKHGEIAKWAIFKETTDHSDVYFALELQIIPDEYFHSTNDFQFRFRYEKQTIDHSKGQQSLIQYGFSNDIYDLQQLFATFYSRLISMPRIQRIRDFLPDKFGSKLLLRSLFVNRLDTQMLDENVSQLIESLWIESIGDLNEILSVQPESISLQTIVEAEASLFEIRSNSPTSADAQQRFYQLIPHHSLFIVDLIGNRPALIEKIDLCQMLRDLSTVNELTNWNIKASIQAKYRALKCHIETIDKETQEFRTLAENIATTTNSNERVVIHQIYSIAKQTDALNFRSNLFNQKQLFHGSKYRNFLGILSRGLLLPKIVSNDLGVTRTDFGCLGYGIYFSDSISTSLKYTTPSTTRPGRRLLCVAQVALGESAKFYSYQPTLTEPPSNFHSSHGVKQTNENGSKFIDNEFAVYHLDQQRLLYLIEVSWIPHDPPDELPRILPIQQENSIEEQIENPIEIPSTIEDEVIQVAEQDYGLICPSSGQLVPLKSFHVRAQLVDVTAQVVLYQVYQNTNSMPIEAKYVFPLDENCSICGFEAHINNKVIKGVVKEKEQAKREYREAIEKGHGAYLMHQEQAEVFSVSVGNLPANCEVIIKITYVAELAIENNDIIFRLPSKVASWQSKQALESKDQNLLPSIDLIGENSSMKFVEFSLKASIRMPYEIMKIFSPTHRLRRKLTDCLAMIEMVDNVLLDKDFILSLTLKSVHLPRLLNETFALTDENNNFVTIDENSQAAMLTFYPKFDLPEQTNECIELIFLLDVSNSMDGKHVQQAKQLAHLFLSSMKPEESNIYFNIVTFGSDNDECFPISSLNTRENITKGKNFILHSLIHRGNTDLFTVLRRYSLLPPLSKFGRQYLLLSDGHINDLSSILTLLTNGKYLRNDRLFTCSIGDTANKHQLKQLANGANAGGLTTIFDSNYRSRWKTKVTNLLEQIRQPCLTNIRIEWHGTIDEENQDEYLFTSQAPKMIRSLFNGMRLTVYRFIRNCHKATLTAMINDQEFVTTIFSTKMTESKGQILHCLTARAIIDDYENGLLHIDQTECELLKKKTKQNLIDLSIKYSVVSSFTSFVAIEERDGEPLQPGVNLLDVMLENDLDLLPYIGWDGDRSQRDLIKEQLINRKRQLIGAGAMTKQNLLEDLEELCQKISYRAGGEEKFELMNTLIETYRSQLKSEDKARILAQQMQQDLRQEMSHATAEERIILEKKLNDIDLSLIDEDEDESLDDQTFYRCSLRSRRQISSNDLQEDFCDDEDANFWNDGDVELGSGGGGGGGEDPMSFPQIESIDSPMYEPITMMLESVCEAAPKKEMIIADESDEEEEAMGFGLFDDSSSGENAMDFTLKKMTVNPSPLKNVVMHMDKQHKISQLSESKEKSDQSEIFVDSESKTLTSPSTPARYSPMSASFSPVNYRTEDRERGARRPVPLSRDTNMKYSFMPKVSADISDFSFCRSSIDDMGNSNLDSVTDSYHAEVKSSFSVDVPQSSSSVVQLSTLSPSQTDQQQPLMMMQCAPVPPPPPPPPGGFSFGGVPAFPSAARTTSLFGSSTSTGSTSLPPPPPPPPPPAMFGGFSFGASGNVPTYARTSNFGSFGSPSSAAPATSLFGTSTSTSIPPPPRVPPPLTSMGPAFSFGATANAAAPASSLFATVASTTNTSFLPTSLPVPPQQPLMSPAFSFGAKNNAAAYAPTLNFGFVSSAAPASSLFATTASTANTFFTPPPPPPPPVFGGFGFGPSASVSTSNADFMPAAASTSASLYSTQTFNEQSLYEPDYYSNPINPTTPSFQLSSESKSDDASSTYTFGTKVNVNTPSLPASESQMTDTGLVGANYYRPQELPQSTINVAARARLLHGRSAAGCMGSAPDPSIRSQNEIESSRRTVVQELETQRNILQGHLEKVLERGEKLSEMTVRSQTLTSHANAFSRKMKKTWEIKSNNNDEVAEQSYHIQDLLLLDVTPLSIGVEDIHGNTCVILERNRTIPTRTEFYPLFTNAYAYQTTATIRIVEGEHKLAKYNNFLGEFILTGLSSNFTSQVLIISVSMDIDANGILKVDAIESRSDAKASLTIKSDSGRLSTKQIEEHLKFVAMDSENRAPIARERSANDRLNMLPGQTEHSLINFSERSNLSKEFSLILPERNLQMTTSKIQQIDQNQLADGSFEMNDEFARIFSIDDNYFHQLKTILSHQGFSSFATNIREEILRLIVTGFFLMEMLKQILPTKRTTWLCPFDHEEIRTILHRHLPQRLLVNVDKAIQFFQEKRARYNVYCHQLELNQSTWEKFIQKSIYNIEF